MTIMKQTQCVTFKHNELRLLKQYSNIKVNWRVLRRQERQCNCTHVVVARGFPLTQLAIYVLVLRTKLFSPLSVLYYYCNFFSWWILSLDGAVASILSPHFVHPRVSMPITFTKRMLARRTTKYWPKLTPQQGKYYCTYIGFL
jgi:hypothetical protein